MLIRQSQQMTKCMHGLLKMRIIMDSFCGIHRERRILLEQVMSRGILDMLVKNTQK